MTNKKKIAADLQTALSGQSPLSIDLYVEVLADYEDELKASLDKDADDALLCMLADDGDVAMMVIDWDGSIYRNENALKKLQAMWRHSFDTNVQTLVPILSDHISQKNLGVAGITHESEIKSTITEPNAITYTPSGHEERWADARP